jgi:hypothetical protein
MANEVINIVWEDRLDSFLKLLERDSEESQFNLQQIQECAHNLRRDYPRQIEIPFFLVRLYRIIGQYAAAWEIVQEIEANQGYWKGPSDMSGSELLFEKSLLAYFHKKDSTQALRLSIEYLNIDESYNWEYIYENLASLCQPLARQPSIKLYRMALPRLGSYHASSISHVHFQGEDCLCARYVNYNIDPSNGVYDCDEFNSTNMAIWGNKMEIIVNNIDIPIQSTKYHGIEDCRLYLDSSGTMRFIGTQQEYVPGGAGINRMIDGRLDMGSFVFCDAKVLYPSDETSLCEKNWIPWLSPGGVMNYIYWWHPFQIGRLNSENRLEIVSEQTVPAFFKGFRGSSCLVPWKNMLCTVVHFVHTPMKGVGTRRYYHCLVFFEVCNDLPFIVKYTLPFTFLVSSETLDRGAIEYCLGFDICGGEGGAIARFWFSCLDADPHRLEIPMEYFESIIA